ncbi:MAG TPA: periplasmic heavy metal sensor [Xanthobacteraceae bacterium]|jgi:uncharacterized membrane protein|nr:periplasmic heavy metal sensor [Xanthobacteraceae bacterium]
MPKIDGGRMRSLLLGSLVLNLLFVGVTGAVALRYSNPVPLATVARIDRNVASRLDRIAASLPPDDAKIMREQLRRDASKVAAAQADMRLAQDDVRNSLRSEPFNADAMRSAMATSRAAHDSFDLVLQNTIGAAAARMSVVGRSKLADWRGDRETAQTARQ